MPLMSIFTWIVFGAIVGVIANVLDPHPARGGLLGAAILGILGALVGGFLSSIIFGIGVTGFNFQSLLVALLGSLLLLFAQRAFIREGSEI